MPLLASSSVQNSALDLEVLVRLFGYQIRQVLTVELVGNKRAVLHGPIGFADLGPVPHFSAVDQRNPAVALAGRYARILKNGRAYEKTSSKCRHALHEPDLCSVLIERNVAPRTAA